jgi:hypothetical protein
MGAWTATLFALVWIAGFVWSIYGAYHAWDRRGDCAWGWLGGTLGTSAVIAVCVACGLRGRLAGEVLMRPWLALCVAAGALVSTAGYLTARPENLNPFALGWYVLLAYGVLRWDLRRGQRTRE